MNLNFEQIRGILPQSFPILMVDKVLECVPGERILAVKAISGSDPVLQGHYPQFAIFPGVYLIETMAQVASILAFCSREAFGMRPGNHEVPLLTSVDRTRFRAPVLPGSLLHIEASFKSKKLQSIHFAASIKCEGRRICDGVLSCAVVRLDSLKSL